jgi:hypothetical protein
VVGNGVRSLAKLAALPVSSRGSDAVNVADARA